MGMDPVSILLIVFWPERRGGRETPERDEKSRTDQELSGASTLWFFLPLQFPPAVIVNMVVSLAIFACLARVEVMIRGKTRLLIFFLRSSMVCLGVSILSQEIGLHLWVTFEVML